LNDVSVFCLELLTMSLHVVDRVRNLRFVEAQPMRYQMRRPSRLKVIHDEVKGDSTAGKTKTAILPSDDAGSHELFE